MRGSVNEKVSVNYHITDIKTPTTQKTYVLNSNEKVICTDYSLKALRESLSLALRISQSFRIISVVSFIRSFQLIR